MAKVTKPETVTTESASIDTAAPAEQTAPIATSAPAHIMPYSLNPITAVMQAMTSITLTDYLTAFYADTEVAVIRGQLSPVLKLILDKGFARHWTEHNSTFSKLPDSAKLASIREAFKYWNVGVLTKSAYDSLFKTAATSTSGKSTNGYKALAARIITMSQSVDVELSHRKHYQKVADNLLKSGKAAYEAMLAIPTAALIIKAAEEAILADVPAAPAIDLDFS
jgi:hypothetical protein